MEGYFGSRVHLIDPDNDNDNDGHTTSGSITPTDRSTTPTDHVTTDRVGPWPLKRGRSSSSWTVVSEGSLSRTLSRAGAESVAGRISRSGSINSTQATKVGTPGTNVEDDHDKEQQQQQQQQSEAESEFAATLKHVDRQCELIRKIIAEEEATVEEAPAPIHEPPCGECERRRQQEQQQQQARRDSDAERDAETPGNQRHCPRCAQLFETDYSSALALPLFVGILMIAVSPWIVMKKFGPDAQRGDDDDDRSETDARHEFWAVLAIPVLGIGLTASVAWIGLFQLGRSSLMPGTRLRGSSAWATLLVFGCVAWPVWLYFCSASWLGRWFD
jgi:hypothetical protein